VNLLCGLARQDHFGSESELVAEEGHQSVRLLQFDLVFGEENQVEDDRRRVEHDFQKDDDLLDGKFLLHVGDVVDYTVHQNEVAYDGEAS
jgi:hypothetical protein